MRGGSFEVQNFLALRELRNGGRWEYFSGEALWEELHC